jgi:hypothetical protein
MRTAADCPRAAARNRSSVSGAKPIEVLEVSRKFRFELCVLSCALDLVGETSKNEVQWDSTVGPTNERKHDGDTMA